MSRAATRKQFKMHVKRGTVLVLAYSARDAHRRVKNMSRARKRRIGIGRG